jgi:hypothetical protein
MKNYVKDESTSAAQRIIVGLLSLALTALLSALSWGALKLSIRAGFSLSGIHLYTLIAFFLTYVFASSAYTLLLKPERHIFPPYVVLALLALLCAGLAAFVVSMALGLMGQVAFHSSTASLIKGLFMGLSGLGVFGLALVQQYRKLRAAGSNDPASAERA